MDVSGLGMWSGEWGQDPSSTRALQSWKYELMLQVSSAKHFASISCRASLKGDLYYTNAANNQPTKC
jgi:hypothetical protein